AGPPRGGRTAGGTADRTPAGVARGSRGGPRPTDGGKGMDIAFCYENVLPSKGGGETYIARPARRPAAGGHPVHPAPRRSGAAALPAALCCHRIRLPRAPRFLRPWFFSAACQRALAGAGHEVTVGFDKAYGLDVLYPQGGLATVAAEHNLRKYRSPA